MISLNVQCFFGAPCEKSRWLRGWKLIELMEWMPIQLSLYDDYSHMERQYLEHMQKEMTLLIRHIEHDKDEEMTKLLQKWPEVLTYHDMDLKGPLITYMEMDLAYTLIEESREIMCQYLRRAGRTNGGDTMSQKWFEERKDEFYRTEQHMYQVQAVWHRAKENWHKTKVYIWEILRDITPEPKKQKDT